MNQYHGGKLFQPSDACDVHQLKVASCDIVAKTKMTSDKQKINFINLKILVFKKHAATYFNKI